MDERRPPRLINAPCKACPDRAVTDTHNCHMTCAKYLSYQRAEKELREQVRRHNIGYVEYRHGK